MSTSHPAPASTSPARQPTPAAPAVTSAAPGPSDHFQLRRREQTSGPARHQRLRAACHRLRLTVQEMNYATRRLVELQTRLP
jgi:hypothetical protein